jgi:putative oxidoreductase
LYIAIAFSVRLLLVLLFLPFSALDKLLNFRAAVAQAREAAPRALAIGLVLAGLFVEIVMSTAILLGVADRAAAFVMACYCVATALLWKQFWTQGAFWSDTNGKARVLFWDFWKNVGLAGGFLLLTFGVTANSVGAAFSDPLGSTHPYSHSGASP